VVGLPHYTVWHLYEPSVDDIRHMEEMEAEKRAREQQERENAEQAKKVQAEFKQVDAQWAEDKQGMADDLVKSQKESLKADIRNDKLNEIKKAKETTKESSTKDAGDSDVAISDLEDETPKNEARSGGKLASTNA